MQAQINRTTMSIARHTEPYKPEAARKKQIQLSTGNINKIQRQKVNEIRALIDSGTDFIGKVSKAGMTNKIVSWKCS